MLEPCSIGFIDRSKIDANHEDETVTKQPRTILMMYLNSVPIYWNSNNNNIVEFIFFGLEFIEMNQFYEYL